MGSMVDTQVLIHACHLDSKKAKSKTHQKEQAYALSKTLPRCQASSALLAKLDIIYVSTVTMVEFYRTSRENHLEWVDSLGDRLHPLALDRASADKAAKLLRSLNTSNDGMCPRCMNQPNDVPCAECNCLLSKYHRVADAMIAATAEMHKEVDVLYCYDGGILKYGEKLSRCTVREPTEYEPPAQAELFDAQGRPLRRVT